MKTFSGFASTLAAAKSVVMSNVARYFIVIYFIVMCVKVFSFVVVWVSRLDQM
jgi:hypothetical protein